MKKIYNKILRNGNVKICSLLICTLTFLCSCSTKKTPENVRELMESEGWNFCYTINTDCYFESNNYEPWIYEDSGIYDLFERRNGDFKEYAITRSNSDNISLSGFDKETESDSFTASYWIIHFAERGQYSLRANHGRAGSGMLGVITKHYTGKVIKNGSGGQIYFNFPSVNMEMQNTNEQSSMQESDALASDEEPVKKYKQCPVCYGSGRCGGCAGTGSTYNSIDYSPGQYVDCVACGGSGECGACEGTGAVEDFGW